MNVSPIAELTKAHADGQLTRDDYWRQMAPLHLALRDHCQLVRDHGLRSIEIREEHLEVVFENGLRMLWNPDDIRAAPNVIVNHGDYESRQMQALNFLAQGCRVALDIGANAGYVALRLGRVLAGQGGAVNAFEPVPKTYAELAYNVRINHLESVIQTHEIAFGESNGTCSFFIPPFHGSVAASRRPLFPQQKNIQVEVQMARLDDFVALRNVRHIDLIKCDVEGAELFVLRGGLQTIREHQPVIMLEMLRKWAKTYEYHPNDIIELLSQFDYECCSCDDGHLISHTSVDDDTTATNFFFLSPRHEQVRRELERGKHLVPLRQKGAA